MSEMDEKEIKQRFEAISKFEISPEVTTRDLEQTRKTLAGKIFTKRPVEFKIWSTIMKSKIIKLAAAAVIIIAVFIVVHFLVDSFENVAFADVINKIRNSSYTFDITTIGDPDSRITAHGMILLSVGLRMDLPNDGGLSSIIDFNTGEGLVLFHGNKLAITDLPDSEKDVMFSGPFSVLLNPIETLWNLHDGTEIPLGENEIDGQSAVGFKVKQINENYNSEIIVWANSQTASPIKLEINLYVPEIQHTVTIIMNNFDLNAKLDKELFSIKPPSGYKVTTFQKFREDPAGAYRGQ